ncbi:MAG: DUF2953 domain-containing protein [Lachnospiraceae bacterium]|nr:DUF2953 domain-containing protein [Lachnospiraceae bacterium]
MGFLLILLQILKWIGIVLAGIVGLVLLILLLLLYVPFRYRIEGEKYETAKAHVTVTWLLHFARYDADYTGGSSFSQKLKVLFFKIMDSTSAVDEEEDTLSDEEAAEYASDLDDLASEDEPGGESTETTGNAENAGSAGDTEAPGTAGSSETAEAGQKPEGEEAAGSGENAEGEEKKEHRTPGEVLQDINDKILEFLEKPGDTISKLLKKKDAIQRFIENEQNRATVSLAKKILVKLLKAILPKKGRGKVKFGTGDPSSTGQLLAAAAVMYIPLKGKMKFTPDFQEKVFEGEGVLKGRIFLGTIIYLAARFWFDKNFKASRKNFEKLKKKLKK